MAITNISAQNDSKIIFTDIQGTARGGDQPQFPD